ncbi:MAG: hypothetical protein IPQ00_03305 [Chloracidobacterium sp.]|nr:hypothetical protein [Chloracidobacterium sp.]
MKAAYKFVAAFAAMLLLTVAACQQTVPFKKFANDDEVPRITLVDAKKAFDEGNAVLVDSSAGTVISRSISPVPSILPTVARHQISILCPRARRSLSIVPEEKNTRVPVWHSK